MASFQTQDKYKMYIEELKKWQNAINLISPSTINNIYERHIVDGISLSNYLKSQFNINMPVTDIGSGAGFPGLVLSIEGFNKITLIESDAKKCSFLKNITRVYNLSDINIINSRVEQIKEKQQIIISRAFKSIKETIELCFQMIDFETSLVLLKGNNVQSEINEAQNFFKFNSSLIKNENPHSDGYIIHIKEVSSQ